MTEEIRTQGCKHDRNKQVLVHGFRRLKKKAEEEYLKTFTEELQEKRRTQEDEVWEEFEEYMCHGTRQKEEWTVLSKRYCCSIQATTQKPRTWKMTLKSYRLGRWKSGDQKDADKPKTWIERQ